MKYSLVVVFLLFIGIARSMPIPEVDDSVVFMPIVSTPFNNGKLGLAYWHGAFTQQHGRELNIGISHHWNTYTFGKYPAIPFIWCMGLSENNPSSWQTMERLYGNQYDGYLFVGNEPDVPGQCGDYAGDNPNDSWARFTRFLSETFPHAKLITPHTHARFFDEPSEHNGFSTIGFIEAYINRYGEFPPIVGIGLHYGSPVSHAREAYYYLLQEYNQDLVIAYTEFQVCGGYQATYTTLQGLNNLPYVIGFFYYTNALPDPIPDHVSATCTLYDRDGDDLIMNERGEAVRDFGKNTVGTNAGVWQ